MKVMITNDDGVYSSGLEATYKAIPDKNDIIIVAPSSQKSGIGRAISLFEPLRVTKIPDFGAEAYAVDGTPTDSVIIGIHSILKNKPDIVVSGINMGENLSTEAITTSGTVGAAMEAATKEIPAISISVQLTDQKDKYYEGKIDVELKAATNILSKIFNGIQKNGFPDGVDILNVNIPSEADRNTPMHVTKLSKRIYDTSVDKREDPRGRPYYWIDGGYLPGAEKGTDVDVVLNKGEISITPISLDMTSEVDVSIEDLL